MEAGAYGFGIYIKGLLRFGLQMSIFGLTLTPGDFPAKKVGQRAVQDSVEPGDGAVRVSQVRGPADGAKIEFLNDLFRRIQVSQAMGEKPEEILPIFREHCCYGWGYVLRRFVEGIYLHVYQPFFRVELGKKSHDKSSIIVILMPLRKVHTVKHCVQNRRSKGVTKPQCYFPRMTKFHRIGLNQLVRQKSKQSSGDTP